MGRNDYPESCRLPPDETGHECKQASGVCCRMLGDYVGEYSVIWGEMTTMGAADYILMRMDMIVTKRAVCGVSCWEIMLGIQRNMGGMTILGVADYILMSWNTNLTKRAVCAISCWKIIFGNTECYGEE